MSLGSLGNNDGNVLRKRNSISEFALLQTLSRLFQLVQFVKCWQIFLELNSKRLYQCFFFPLSYRAILFTLSEKVRVRDKVFFN